MSEPGSPGPQDSLPGDGDDGDLGLAALRARGAHRFDPMRFRYLEALAWRRAAHGGELRRALDLRLAQALAAYTARHDQARAEAGQALTQWMQRLPDAAEALRQLHADGDFAGLRRLADRLDAQARPAPLVELVRHLDPQAAAQRETGSTDAPTELKALRQFKSTWTRLSVDRQLNQSLARAPDKPGPLNSHLLALRSLRLMQDISPAYLNRFMSHVDALLWLDAASLGSPSVPSQVMRREGDKKRKSGRGKSG